MTPSPSAAEPLSTSPDTERARLDDVAQWFDSRRGLNYEVSRRALKHILSRAHGSRALELGCAGGAMSEDLAGSFPHLDIVEGAARYVAQVRALLGARNSHPGRLRVHHCLFEEFLPSAPYDLIVMAYVLEHVSEPRTLLARAKDWLAQAGEIHIVVPNAESLHRRVGRHMGLLPRFDQLNETDLAIGHRRVYTWDRLADDIAAAGLQLALMEGILLKPLPSALMEAWPRELRDAFFDLAPLAPKLCSEIYAVCHHPNHGHSPHSPHGLR